MASPAADAVVVFLVVVVVLVGRRPDGRVDGVRPDGGRLLLRLRRRRRLGLDGRLLMVVATGRGGPVMVVREIRVRPAAVVVLGDGQRAEIERLLVGGCGRGGRGQVARRPAAGQQAADAVVLLQDHRGRRGRRGCRLVRRRRVVVVVVLAAVVVVVVQVVELVQVTVELEPGRVELVRELRLVVADPAVLGAGGRRGQPEPLSAGHRG